MPIPAGPDTSIMTVADAKQQLNIPTSDTSQDDELAGYIDSVTEVIEHIVGPVVPREVVEVHDGGSTAVVLHETPVLSVTSVAEGGVDVLSTGWSLSSAGILYRATGAWLAGRGTVTVAYQAGRATVPASIRQAAKELVAVNFRGQLGGNHSVFDGGAPQPSSPGEVRLGFFIPNRVMQLLRPHRQDGWLP